MKFSVPLPELHIIILHSITAGRENQRSNWRAQVSISTEGLSISFISEDSQRHSLRDLILALQIALNLKWK